MRVLGLLPAAVVVLAHVTACGDVPAPSRSLGDAGARDGSAFGASDAAPISVDASSCHPGDVETYVAPPYHPALQSPGACGPGAAGNVSQLFYSSCFGPGATSAGCVGYAQSYASCAQCVMTPGAADHYGPLVDLGGFITQNVAGCIELVDPSPVALSCAKALQAQVGCERAACAANCPVYDPPSLHAYNDCAAAADEAGCRSYAATSACANVERDGGPASMCFGSLQDFFSFAALFFCGPAPDAGPDASVDAGVRWDSGAGALEDAAPDARQ